MTNSNGFDHNIENITPDDSQSLLQEDDYYSQFRNRQNNLRQNTSENENLNEGGDDQNDERQIPNIYFKNDQEFKLQEGSKEVSIVFQMWLRGSLAVFVIIACAVNDFLQKDWKAEDFEYIRGEKDYVFIWTTPLNEWFKEDLIRRDILEIFCSELMDVLMIISFYRFARYSSTWRLPLAMASFYGLRAILQSIWYVEKPDGYNWAFPGFLSIFVPYGETADFFYSGHVGVCIIMFLEFYSVGWYVMSIYSLFVAFAQGFMMIVLRAHYTIDIISGILFAHYFWIIAEKYCYLVDWYCYGIPLEKRQTFSRSLSDDEIKQMYQNQMREKGFTDDSSDPLSADNNFISTPIGGIGYYFISCRNCSNPIGNYMTQEQSVNHFKDLPNGETRQYSEGPQDEIENENHFMIERDDVSRISLDH